MREKFSTTGAVFKAYPLQDFEARIKEMEKCTHNFLVVAKLLIDLDALVIQSVLDDIKSEKPDFILHDSMCPWGKDIVRFLKIKAISSVTLFVANKQDYLATKELKQSMVKMILSAWYYLPLTYMKMVSLKLVYGLPIKNLSEIFINE